MKPSTLRRLAIAAALLIAMAAAGQASLASTEAAGKSQLVEKPGPTAKGQPVDSKGLVPIPHGDIPQQVRESPRLFPVDRATFDQIKAQLDADATARDRSQGGGTGTGTAPNFPSLGFTQTGGWNPPDAGLAVGPSSILVAVNEAFAIYDKSGNTLQGPISFGSFFGTSDSTFDPRALYDNGNASNTGFSGGHGRFVLLAVSQNGSAGSSKYMLAVSRDENPQTSGWCTYPLNAVTGSGSSAAWADFPGLGMDGNNLYITSNQFTFSGNSFQFARALTIPKASVYPNATSGQCGTASSTDYQNLLDPNGSASFTVQPANQFAALPGSTTPMYFVNAIWSSGSQLVVRSISAMGSPSYVPVSPYSLPANAPQPGRRAKRIDTGDDRLLGAAFLNNTIYTSNTTGTVSSALSTTPNAYANAQWYAISVGSSYSATSRAITNQSVAYYYPAVAPGNGFVALEVTGSSSTQPASAYYVGSSGTPTIYATGVSSYSLSSRWGDYAAAAPDPSNGGSTVWVLGEYAKTSNGWGTAVTHVP